jgi:hypothetical protein
VRRPLLERTSKTSDARASATRHRSCEVLTAARWDRRSNIYHQPRCDTARARNRQGLAESLDVAALKKSLDAIAAQRWAEVDGAEKAMFIGTPETLTERSTEIDREFYDYYRTPRGGARRRRGCESRSQTAPLSQPARLQIPTSCQACSRCQTSWAPVGFAPPA